MLRKLFPIVALFFAALVLFPGVAKTVHELTHEHEPECHVDGAHFCQHEHSCPVCDYTLSPSLTPPLLAVELSATVEQGQTAPVHYSTNHLSHNGFSFSLRGPPAC